MSRNVFLPDRVKKVDQIGQNILVRSCMPLVGDPYAFAYKELEEALGLPLSGFEPNVISLIDCTGERFMLEPELAAFGVGAKGPSYWPPYLQSGWDPSAAQGGTLTTEGVSVPAKVFWWPIEGFAEGEDPRAYLTSPGWDLSGLVQLVAGLMEDQSGAPKAVIVHCTLGADRTGALHTSYLVNRGYTLDEASAVADASTSAGAPNADYVRLRTAYAASRQR